MSPTRKANSLRIIGGNWRGRKVSFAEVADIRPTPDRVRETLFNWLQADITGARCLELYAGSGILSFEALSRGATSATLIDTSREVTSHLNATATMLDVTSKVTLITGDASRELAGLSDTFDIVFADPPFRDADIQGLTGAISRAGILVREALVYLETPVAVTAGDLPQGWDIEKQKRAGAVHYCLCVTSQDAR